MSWYWLRSHVASILFGSQRRRLGSRLLVNVAGGHRRKWRECWRWRNGAWRILGWPRHWLTRSRLVLLCHWVWWRLIARVTGRRLAVSTAVWARFYATIQHGMYTIMPWYMWSNVISKLLQPSSTSDWNNFHLRAWKQACNYFKIMISEAYCSSWIFSNVFDVAEIISAAEIILFQSQTWLRVFFLTRNHHQWLHVK